VGVHFDVSTTDGFFVSRFEDYAAVDRFDGCLREQPWSLPDGWRAARTWDLEYPPVGGGAAGECAEPALKRREISADGSSLGAASAVEA
jgi:hypothetical protein